VKPIDKREGAGSRNWGTYKDDVLADGTNPSAEESMEEKTDSNNTTITDGEAGDAEKTENGTAPPADGEPKQMTLGEWKALQEKEAQSRPKPVFNLRKAGEGEDQSQWKNLTLKTKEKVVSTEEEEEEEYSGEFPQRAGRQKQLLDVNFHFADSRRGADSRYSGPPRGGMRGDRQRSSETLRGGRGFGGAPRGGGFRGGFRGGSRGYSPRDEHPARQTAPKVDDERDFPSLG
jgi:plasminogen activator inhibitor 1 RNA-binding protein